MDPLPTAMDADPNPEEEVISGWRVEVVGESEGEGEGESRGEA